MCRSSYQPLRSGSASEAILCSGVVRRGLGRRACTGTHESGRAPRRRLVPQPAPPCRGPYAGVQHRHRLRASGVGYSLAPSPTAPSPAASRRAKRSRLRHRWPPPRFPAPPPGGRLRLAPWPDARPCADGALRHGPTEQRPPGQSLLRPRTAAAVAGPPLRPFHQCVSCVRVYCLSRLYLRAASLLRGSGCPLTLRYICLAYRLKSSLSREENVKLSPVEVSAVACRVRAAIVTGEACAASNDAQKTGHTNAVKDRRGT